MSCLSFKRATATGIVTCVCSFIIVCVFNALAGSQAGVDSGIFTQSTANVSDKFETDVTPAGWTFSIWGIIYFWQAAWLVYSASTLCRQGIDGPLYYSPGLLPPLLFLLYFINNVANVVWLVFWDREYFEATLVFFAIIVGTLYIAIPTSCIRLKKKLNLLHDHGLMLEAWLIRIFVHNGLAMYAAWTTIASLINVAIISEYYVGDSKSAAGTIALSILAFFLLMYFICDIFIRDNYTRYLVSPYFVVVWALAGIFSKKWSADDPSINNVFTAVLLGVSALMLLIKICVLSFRHRLDSKIVIASMMTPRHAKTNNVV